MSNLTGWFKENQPLAIALAAQAILAGIYLVNLEARTSTLEVRGSPHLAEITTRLTVLESNTANNKEAIERLKDEFLKSRISK